MKSYDKVKLLAKSLVNLTPYRVVHKNSKLFKKPPSKNSVQYLPQIPEAGCYLSLIIPAYNTEEYIDQLLASIFSQSADFDNFEVIIVDDGSTDKTSEVIKAWAARRPDHIRYVYQKNAGAAAARNVGLEMAKGTWVGFPDSDDFLHVDYFAHMLKETTAKLTQPLLVVTSNFIQYFEEQNAFSNTHPLRYRFQKGIVRKSTTDLGQYMQLSTNSTWIHCETLKRQGIKFDSRVVPAFEDAHFINTLFIKAPGMTISFIPSAIYYYRKRAAPTSLLSGTSTSINWFAAQIEYGYLDLLSTARISLGEVPFFIQRTCLYSMLWRFRRLVDHPEGSAFLTNEQRSRFLDLVEEVFAYIDPAVIENFDLAGCTEEHKVALLAIYKNQRRSSTAVYINQIDQDAGIAQFSSFSGGDDEIDLRILVNGAETMPILSSERRSDFMGQPYVQQRFFWVPLKDGDDISFEVDGVPCRIRRAGNALGKQVTWISLYNALKHAKNYRRTPDTQRLRSHVLASRDLYAGGRVLMDGIEKADDNAEHLYRYMMETGQSDRAWFILSADSPDWPRLEAEGFQLLPFGSDDHIAAQLNADFFMSSHIDHNVINPVPRGNFADLAHFQFVFLQHGVTMNDLSHWLNQKPIRLFVTAMPKEYSSIAHPDSPYVFTERETLLSGFPRHDSLISKADTAKADSIVIMPTWRKYLTEVQSVEGTGQLIRVKSDAFPGSDFARNWTAVLKSPRLKEYSENHELRVVFAPHPNMAMYLEDMDIPDWIEKIDVRSGISYQDFFASARIAISDYSSAITEVAYLQRPLIYFQFDSAEIFSGNHVCQPGYFSHQHDGFGPVVETAEAVLDSLEKALNGQEDPVYVTRRQDAFPHRDGKCCERVCAAIDKIAHAGAKNSVSKGYI